MNRFRHTVSVLSLVMVLLLLAGCLPKAGVTEYTLTVNVKPEGAAEVKGVAEKYEKNTIVTFKLIANEGYEFVEWEDDVKPTQISDGQWLIIMDGDKTLTAVFKGIEEEEEEDIEELIAAAKAAIEALPEKITLEHADQVAEARELVNAVLAIDEDAEIEGIEKLEALEEALQILPWLQVNEDLVADALKKVNEGLDLEKEFRGEALNLPEELTVGADSHPVISYVLIWTTDSPDVVEIEEEEEEGGLKAKITRPEETTTVTLTATLGYDISAQAETKPQSFDVQIKVWGLVPELKSLADDGEDEEFKRLLVILVPDYDKNLVADIKDAIVADLKVAIAELPKLETKEKLLQVIAEVTEANTVRVINQTTDPETLAEIIWNLKVAEFINLAGKDAREEVARAVMAPADKPYKSTAEFKAAVVEVVATYLELIEAVETAGDKAHLAKALTAAFEFIDKRVPVTSMMVDNVWESKAGEDFKGFKNITEIWTVANSA